MSFRLPPQLFGPGGPPLTIQDLYPAEQKFLTLFPNTVYTLIYEAEWAEAEYHLPQPTQRVVQARYPASFRTDEGFGAYFSVNGFDDSNAVGISKMRDLASLKNINAFFVDIDWPKNATMEKTPENLAAFKQDIKEDLTKMAALGQPYPNVVVESKNGIHAYWVLERPLFLADLSEEEKTKIINAYSATELGIIRRFHGDPQAKDLSRVLRVPGTFHVGKTPKPFRIKIVWDQASSGKLYSFDEVATFFASDRAEDEAPHARFFSQEADVKSQVFYLSGEVGKSSDAFLNRIQFIKAGQRFTPDPEVIRELGRRYPKTERPSIQALMSQTGVMEGSRNLSLLIAASAMRESGMNEDQVHGHFAGGYNGLSPYEIKQTIKSAFKPSVPYEFGWRHPLIHPTEDERRKIKETVKAIVQEREQKYLEEKRREREANESPSEEKDTKEDTVTAAQEAKAKAQAEEEGAIKDKALELEKPRPAPPKIPTLSKDAQRELYAIFEHDFRNVYKNLRYVVGYGFYKFEAGVFHPVSESQVRSWMYNYMEAIGLTIYRESSRIRTKIECFSSLPGVRIDPESYPPTLLPVQNGILDLEKRTLYEHGSNFFVLGHSEARFLAQTDKVPTEWLTFLARVTENDASKIAFLQEMFGYCLTADVSHQLAFILIGAGANGKSTFIDTMMRVVGHAHCSSLTLDMLVKQFQVSGLQGKRLNVVEEISNNYFESDQIKRLVSGQEITADRKYQEAVRFRPVAKFVFAVNKLPKVNDTSEALYRRFRIVPFNVVIPVDERDPLLGEKLAQEVDLILLWALDGLARLRKQKHFTSFSGEKEAIDLFRQDNSPITEMLLEEYEVLADAKTPASELRKFSIDAFDLYNVYKIWCAERRYLAKNFTNFREDLTHLGHSALKHLIFDPHASHLCGLRRKNDAPPSVPFTPVSRNSAF